MWHLILQLNPGRQGFYRVSYSSDLYSPLLPALQDGSLSAQDRLGLQNDAFALVSNIFFSLWFVGGSAVIYCDIGPSSLFFFPSFSPLPPDQGEKGIFPSRPPPSPFPPSSSPFSSLWRKKNLPPPPPPLFRPLPPTPPYSSSALPPSLPPSRQRRRKEKS